MSALLSRAEELVGRGRGGEARLLLENAGQHGDASAWFQLAIWSLVGSPIPRDLSGARRYLRQAVEIGHVDAALMEVALTGNGTGAAPDWRLALERLTVAARDDPVAAEQLALLNQMALDVQGQPLSTPEAERLGQAPEVLRYPALLTAAECAHIAQAAQELLEPSTVIDPRTRRAIPHPVRSSHHAALGPTRETLPIQAVLRRVAAITGTAVAQGEPLTVLCYRPGDQYRPHHDALPGARNQRVKTVLLYLNDGYEGGETEFLNNRLKVRGRPGDAIAFDNVRPDGQPDLLSRHAGLPVRRGSKWLATRWIRAAPYDPWTAS